MKKVKYLFLLILPLLVWYCADDEARREEVAPPAITFVPDERERQVKAGDSIVLSAVVDNAVYPVFSWKIDREIVSTGRSYTFHAGQPGDYFINFRVDAGNGSAEEQLKLSVVEKLSPRVVLSPAEVAYVGIDKTFTATVENVEEGEQVAYLWRLDGEIVSETGSYTFNETVMRTYVLSLKVTTPGGQDLKNSSVMVLPEQSPGLFFDNGRYRAPSNANEQRAMTVPLGKSLVLTPVVVNIDNPGAFTWKVDGTPLATAGEFLTFTPASEGVYIVTTTEPGTGATAEVKVTCTPAEGTYLRSGGSNKYANKAYYYMAAPGQYVNNLSATTAAAALTALNNWSGSDNGGYFHVGAFGGYFILGFDHSVQDKKGEPDIAIGGNAFAGWCESGIVWVMQDENGNGLPDDTWYELRGSETGKPSTKQRYAITYYKPAADNLNPVWTDNMGHSGSINRAGIYPKFTTEAYYTLVGTCLGSTFNVGGSGL